jgi:hypothetical protein
VELGIVKLSISRCIVTWNRQIENG